jgi:hypothetical protein
VEDPLGDLCLLFPALPRPTKHRADMPRRALRAFTPPDKGAPMKGAPGGGAPSPVNPSLPPSRDERDERDERE